MRDDHDDGGPAFPRQFKRWDNDYMRWEPQEPEEGLTIRDYFAIEALNGIIACFKDHAGCETLSTRAAKAYEYADAMLKARSA